MMQSCPEFVTWQEDGTAAPEALQSDIGSDSGHLPFRAATGMPLAKYDHISRHDAQCGFDMRIVRIVHLVNLWRLISSLRLMALCLAASAKSDADDA